MKSWQNLGLLLLFLSAMGMGLSAPSLAATEGTPAWVPPWQVWTDLRSLAVLPAGDQVLLRSSHCPSGCRFDRHSDGDARFIRVDGEEGVIFEESGPGAITRIWMTTGVSGVSVPLDPSIRIRFYLDGEQTPRIDLALPELFDGSVSPFLPPLVGDRSQSSGGNYSYVPIAYQDGCRISLVGAETAKLWFQFTYHRLPTDRAVASFTGNEDLSAWQTWLSSPGDDPWPADSGHMTEGQIVLLPGQTQTVFSSVGPGLINALRLDLDEHAWASTQVRLRFDEETTVDLSAADLFAIGRGGATPTRSLLLGVNADGELYSYFPMPYFQHAELILQNSAQAGSGGVTIHYAVRNDSTSPSPHSGLFGASLNSANPTTPGNDFSLLSLDRPGKWVGLFAELGSVETLSREYLEGDERVFLDGSRHPGIYGTGVEDMFNGGFYFDQGVVGLALHGMSYHLVTEEQEDVTAAYRLMLTDAVPFAAGIQAGMEGGPTSNIPMRARTVAYHYTSHQQDLILADLLDLSDPASIAAHSYTTDGPHQQAQLDAVFEGEPPQQLIAEGWYRTAGTASFSLDASHCRDGLRLRRLFDAGTAGQAAAIFVDGAPSGTLPFTDANPAHRWRELDVDLAALTPGNTSLQVSVVGAPSAPDDGPFSEFQYQLWCRQQCGSGPFQQSEDWTLMDEVTTGVKNYRATYSIEAGPAFSVTPTGCASFSAGETITLHPGFRVERGGRFEATIE